MARCTARSLVECAVLCFQQPESVGEKGEQLPFPVQVLFEYSADTGFASISSQGHGSLHGRVNQHRGGQQGLFGCFESGIQLWRPWKDVHLLFPGSSEKRGQEKVDVGHILIVEVYHTCEPEDLLP